MNQLTFRSDRRQRGVATLLTSLMVLFVMTLITFYATQSTVMETNVSANQYRTDQAYAAASGAMDYAEARFAAVGLDSVTPGVADCTAADPCNFNIANPAATQTLPARYFFCDPDQLNPSGTLITAAAALTACTETGVPAIWGSGRYDGQVGIVAVGFSDDSTAERVMVRSAAVADLMADGPGSSLSSGGAVNVTGNIAAINRFSNFSVWSGQDFQGSGSADTYLAGGTYGGAPLTSERCMSNFRSSPQDAALHAACVQHGGNASQLQYASNATDKQRGPNFDVVYNDPNLDRLRANPDLFWDNFFDNTQQAAWEAANTAGQVNVTPTSTMTGVIWFDGNATISGPLGSAAQRKSVLIVVNGDADISGNSDIYGIVYVKGSMSFRAGPNIQGMLIVRNGTSGGGNMQVIYDPNVIGDLNPPLNGGVAGSWRDW